MKSWPIIRHIRYFFSNLKRLIEWIPIIWEDRDWDSAYLFSIMSYKIGRMRESIGEEDRHTCAQKNCRDMRIAELYLNRIVDDDTPLQNAYFCTCSDNILDDGFCIACQEYLGLLPSIRIRRKRTRYPKKRQYSNHERALWENFIKHFSKHSRSWWS